MFSGYHKFTRAVALKCVSRPVDVPNIQLGTAPYELLEPVKNGKPIQSQPMQMNYRGVDTGGVKLGQTYEGVAGFGNLVPMVGPGEIPYYGPWTGGE